MKKRPGQVNVAVLSRGGIPHLTAEWIKLVADLEWTSINYPGTPAGLSDVIGGRVQVIMDGLPSLAGSISGGQLKLLAVGSAKRLPQAISIQCRRRSCWRISEPSRRSGSR
jgi:tripartite-type tricarboxylate transporter receptor subunit TctC